MPAPALPPPTLDAATIAAVRRDPRYRAQYSLEANVEYLKRADLAIGQRKRRELKAVMRRERRRQEEGMKGEVGKQGMKKEEGEGVKEEEEEEEYAGEAMGVDEEEEEEETVVKREREK